MKKAVLILIIMILAPIAFAKNANSKNFNKGADELFLTSVLSLKELGFNILEIQSESGYILFQSSIGDEYLLMVSENGVNSSGLKIQKMKNSSPLLEIQTKIYDKIEENIKYDFKRADE